MADFASRQAHKLHSSIARYMDVYSAHFAPAGLNYSKFLFDGKDMRVKIRGDLCQTKRIFKGRVKVTLLKDDGSFETPLD